MANHSWVPVKNIPEAYDGPLWVPVPEDEEPGKPAWVPVWAQDKTGPYWVLVDALDGYVGPRWYAVPEENVPTFSLHPGAKFWVITGFEGWNFSSAPFWVPAGRTAKRPFAFL